MGDRGADHLIEANGLSFTADLGTGVESEGSGELVVFLHGFPHTRHTWRAELAALDELGYLVVAFDQRGYSPGARPEGVDAYRVENLVADVFAVTESVAAANHGADDGAFHLVGHDWGGQLGWIIAALHPERVRTLSVISRPHPAAFMQAMGASTPQPGDVPPVTVPTQYVWGDDDASVGRIAAETTADFVDGPYRFAEIAGGSHCITDQSPGLFTGLLVDHIRSGGS